MRAKVVRRTANAGAAAQALASAARVEHILAPNPSAATSPWWGSGQASCHELYKFATENS